MPEKQSSQAQTNSKGGNGWWIPLAIGLLLLMVPGGIYATPMFLIIAIIMKKRSKKSPRNLPPLTITPN